MAWIGSKCLARALALSLGATILLQQTLPARAASRFSISRGATGAPKALGPAAIPVPVLKALTAAPEPARETTPAEIRQTLQVTRDFSALAERAGIEAALQLDPTLRRGDIAVTATGLHVFRGPHADFHPESDFEPLAKSNLARRPDLRAMQVAGRYDQPPAGVKAAFLGVLTVRATRKFAEVAAPVAHKHGFQVVRIPPMR